MIRFPCSNCRRIVKAPEEQAGTTIRCPRCNKRLEVPSAPVPSAAAEPAAALELGGELAGAPERRRPTPGRWDQFWAFFAGMGVWYRCAVALVVAVGLGSLLLRLLAPNLRLSEEAAESARHAAVLVVPSCLVILMVIVYGYGTSCPSCGKPWASNRRESELLDRHVSTKGGVPWVRSTEQTTYACKYCRHTWTKTYTDEYKEFVRPGKKRKPL
jgi:DNA-directed RNA polymerase subunit RPC12/RpoP